MSDDDRNNGKKIRLLTSGSAISAADHTYSYIHTQQWLATLEDTVRIIPYPYRV